MDIFSAACMFFGGVTFSDYMFPFHPHMYLELLSDITNISGQ